MRIHTKIVIVFLLLLSTSCVHVSSPNIAENDNISANEAVLLTRVYGALVPAQIAVHNEDDGPIGLPIARLAVTADGQILAVKIRSGEHLRISQYGSLRGKAIGDFFVEERESSVFIVMKDQETSTVQTARNNFPWLFSKLPTAKSFAGGLTFQPTK
jgi:hypothetical protein